MQVQVNTRVLYGPWFCCEIERDGVPMFAWIQKKLSNYFCKCSSFIPTPSNRNHMTWYELSRYNKIWQIQVSSTQSSIHMENPLIIIIAGVYGSINTRIINLMSSFKVLFNRDTWKSVTCKCPRCPIRAFHVQKCAIKTIHFHFWLVVLKWTLLEKTHPSSEFFSNWVNT